MNAVTLHEEPGLVGRKRARTLDLVWLVPVAVATLASVVTVNHPVVTIPLLGIALVPWGLHAARRTLPAWLFGVIAITPVAILMVVQGLSSSVFLGTTALCLLASRASRGWQLAVVVAVAVLLPFTSALGPGPFDPGSFYFAIGDLFGVTVGLLLGYSRRLADELRAADARLVALRAQTERTRLARDVHDLVAHSLTVVVLHIGGARRVLRSEPGQAENALEQAETVCRESLDGIRRVVGLLRTTDDLQASTGDLAGLVQTYTATGMQLEADLDADLGRLPLFARGLVHRVVQESLANAARYHRPGSVVDLTCRLDGEDVHVVVTNQTDHRHHASSGGYGLLGLCEQVADAGGQLTSRYDEGRWRLSLRLPLAPAPQPAQAAS